MAHGVVNGPARIVGPNSTEIGGVAIPKGVSLTSQLVRAYSQQLPRQTIVSMGATFVHNNADIFPDPFKFSPDRWLQPNSNELDTYLVAFSKGPRSCLGIK